ncbi:MAG: nuclear transport factor 2 family protein [Solirubrobacterales bacterium]
MSQESIETARDAVDAFNRDDREAWIALCDEDAELYSLRSQLEGRPYRGHEGMRQFLVDADQDWENLRIDVREIRDAGSEVVVLADFRARGGTSGVELDFPVGMVVRVRAGKITYGRFYSNPDEALAAAGLSE